MTTATSGPATETVRKVADLLDDRRYHIEFNGHLTNHVKHAVVALAAIGASEPVIRGYYNDYVALTCGCRKSAPTSTQEVPLCLSRSPVQEPIEMQGYRLEASRLPGRERRLRCPAPHN